jgi:hypothetical protein
VLGGFFLSLNGQPFPVRLFTDAAAALAWLKESRTSQEQARQ